MAHNFKKLDVWKKGIDLTDVIYSYTKTLPVQEKYNLIDQMNRSSCSIPSNIAEGSGKRSNLQFGEYLSIALTSAYELETQLLIAERRNYGDTSLLNHSKQMVQELQKMIFTFREKILNDSN